MINVDFKTVEYKEGFICDGCTNDLRYNQTYFELYLDQIGQTLTLCEYCGNNLQNDMMDEYRKFVGLGM